VISRDEAIDLLQQQHAAVGVLFADLDDEAFSRRGTIGGGEWSAKDLAAHLGSWEEFALETIEGVRAGRVPAIEAALAAEGGTDRVNDEQVRRFLAVDPAAVRARFEDLHGRIVGAIEGMDDAEWSSAYAHNPEDATLGERVGGLLGSDEGGFRHASAHLEDLRAYVDSTSR
jgi:hypothetical protein